MIVCIGVLQAASVMKSVSDYIIFRVESTQMQKGSLPSPMPQSFALVTILNTTGKYKNLIVNIITE